MTSHSPHDLAVAEKLGELKAGMAALQTSIIEVREAVSGRTAPLEARVSRLESWRYQVIGGAAVVAYIVQFIPKPF